MGRPGTVRHHFFVHAISRAGVERDAMVGIWRNGAFTRRVEFVRNELCLVGPEHRKEERVGAPGGERDHSWTLCSDRDSRSGHSRSQPSDPVAHTRQRCATRATRADSEHHARVVGGTAVETGRQLGGRVAVERDDADAYVDAVGAGKRGIEQSSRISLGGDAIEPEALVARLLGQSREAADGFGPERARYPDTPLRRAHRAHATRDSAGWPCEGGSYGYPSLHATWLIQLRDDRFEAVGARCSVRTP